MKIEKGEWPGKKRNPKGTWMEFVQGLNGDTLTISADGLREILSAREGISYAAKKLGIPVEMTLREGVLYVRKAAQS